MASLPHWMTDVPPRIKGYCENCPVVGAETSIIPPTHRGTGTMSDLSFRKRHRLKGREVKAVGAKMEAAVGVDMLSTEPAVDRARGLDMDYLIVGGRVAYLLVDEVAFPSLRTLLDRGLDVRWIEVDEGAVRFLANGADVMAPA